MNPFERSIQLLGEAAFSRLQTRRVILFGVGGVGGWCAEALVRTGLRHLTIVDFDTVSTGNINRQAAATALTVGQPKAEAMRRRLLDICPDADITALNCRYTPENADIFHLSDYDYILDAIDSTECKAHLMVQALRTNAVFFSSMGAGRKLDPTRVHIKPFKQVEGCPLARALRTRLRKTGQMPDKPFMCVYSDEQPLAGGGEGIGSLMPVVGTFGMTLASLVLTDIINTRYE